MGYAEIAVNSPGAGRRTFCYEVPQGIVAGHAAWVPFGPRLVQGVVMELTEHPSVEDTKKIVSIIDERPILSAAQVRLALWLSSRYLVPLFDAVSLMLPPGFGRKTITFVNPVDTSDVDITTLSPNIRTLLSLLEKEGRMAMPDIERALGKRQAVNVVGQLMRRGLITKSHELEKPKVRPKMVRYVRLGIDAEAAQLEADGLLARRATAQARMLAFLAAGHRFIPLSEAIRHTGCSGDVIRSLEKRGLLSIEQVRIYRDPLAGRSFHLLSAPVLTSAQEAAWSHIRVAMMADKTSLCRSPQVFLLHGVTGSGKTEVYLRALEETVSRRMKAIVLVPEIALTPQTIERFAFRFPGRVAVMHSKLSVGEQFDEWWRIKEGGFDVVIGSRGAIFAPQPDIGLIVIDEEHEWTYKQQEQSPYYHARDVAIRLAELTGAVVILGSATPDISSYYHSTNGEYRLLRLIQRFDKTGTRSDSLLPDVEIVDLRQELKAGNRSIFSRSLATRIERALAASQQVILFLNRRGTSTFVQCRHCGEVLGCKRCDIPLTYHSEGEELVCHQCNCRSAVPACCPKCGSRQIKFLGIGTQRVAEETRRAFPGVRVSRWDRDVTRKKHSHEEILARFLAHEADVLVGTQMIAKGLELPLVTLVGVVNADVSLHLPDFRAAERTFQILSQVAGRAGRGAMAGHVVFQSYNPDHYAIVAASKHDYFSFYEHEISLRRQYGNPPFNQLARLVYTSPNESACWRETSRMHQHLRDEQHAWGINTSLIGPAPCFVRRLRGRYRWQVIIRGADVVSLLERLPIPQGWVVDIDPVSLL